MMQYELLELCTALTAEYREYMAIDPTILIKYSAADLASEVSIVKGQTPMTWHATVSPGHHAEVGDVRDTVVDVLAHVMLNEFDFIQHPSAAEARDRIQVRLRITLANLLPGLE